MSATTPALYSTPDQMDFKTDLVYPVRNSSGALNPAGINLKCNPAAEHRGIISNGVKQDDLNSKIEHYKPQAKVYSDAIRTIFRKPPKEVILFFLHIMEPVALNSILSRRGESEQGWVGS